MLYFTLNRRLMDHSIETTENGLSLTAVDKAIKLSCVQSMLGAMFTAVCGGMFIIGFALKMHADDRTIGLITTIPMFCVVSQLISAMLVERGHSRRNMTIWSSALAVVGWPFIAALPYFSGASSSTKLWLLIALITFMNIWGMFASNVRSSWIGDLIPARQRGEYFGKLLTFSGIISAIMGVAGGYFLDYAKKSGTASFSLLFLFGMICGLIVAVLYLPQADIPAAKLETGTSMKNMLSETLKNRPFMVVIFYAVVWSMQAIAGPFVVTYMLRDLKLSYLSIGLMTAVTTVCVLFSSAFWGRMVDKFGCKPIIILGTALIAPLPITWLWIASPAAAYITLPLVNIVVGLASAGISVALTTLIYGVTPAAGRSVQLAVYSIVVTLLAAPMPAIGGLLPGWIRAMGIETDVRCTFYATMLFTFGSLFIALRIPERDSKTVKELSAGISEHLVSKFKRFTRPRFNRL